MSRPLNPWKLSGYKPGQNVICRVTNAEPGGYAVVITKDNLPGFLPTPTRLRTGEEILAQFVCVHNNRILLAARFSTTSSVGTTKTQSHQPVDWGAQLSDLDHPGGNSSNYPEIDADPESTNAPELITGTPSKTSLTTSSPGPSALPTLPPATAIAPPTQSHSAAPKQLLQTHIQTPLNLSEEEAAFDVWAQSQPRRFHLKRATDLMLPPVDTDAEQKFKIADYDVEWLITHLEGGMTTGCVKASSEERLSRSALLLYRGRAVGCIYGCKTMPETQPTEQSLQLMLADLQLPETLVRMYDLPENVTLAMSALFLGYPVQRNDDYDARAYMDYICGWFESKGQTACLAITLPASAATCLGFIYKGQFCGAFYVEDQKFTPNINFVYDLLKSDPKANVEASILPPEMTSSAVRFGFSLSMARTRRDA